MVVFAGSCTASARLLGKGRECCIRFLAGWPTRHTLEDQLFEAEARRILQLESAIGLLCRRWPISSMSILTPATVISRLGPLVSIDCARSKGVPVWNADQWLSFTQTRHHATYNTIAWNTSSGVLCFTITIARLILSRFKRSSR